MSRRGLKRGLTAASHIVVAAFGGVTASLLVAAFGGVASAHELLVDELRFWKVPLLNAASTEASSDSSVTEDDDGAALPRVRGQLTLDPELTRSLDEELDVVEHGRRVEAFVRAQLHVRVDGRECRTDYEVRELYVRGGAAPGDIVMLSCAAPHDWMNLEVSLGPRLPALVVTATGLQSPHGSSAALVRSGESQRFRAQTASKGPAPPPPSDPVNGELPAPHSRAVDTSRELEGATTDRADRGRDLKQSMLGSLRQGLSHAFVRGIEPLLLALALTLYAYRRPKHLMTLWGAFTVAHTVGVGWVWFGSPLPPQSIVGPTVTSTVAATAILAYKQTRWRSALPALSLFGLIHGWGDAGALSRAKVPLSTSIATLLGFNAGVGLAQLAVGALVATALLVMSRRSGASARRVYHCARWTALGIVVLGVVRAAQRVLS